ncbi:bacillithiol system redox-active protein YtxJ [Sinomicrobium sp.]
MGFFDKIFGRGAESDKNHNSAGELNWFPLNSLEQLDQIATESTSVPIAIFKHSTRCGISKMVYGNLQRDMDSSTAVKLYYLDLLNHRDVSNAIATRFGIVHESPQLLLIKDGKVVYNASHEAITASELLEQLG